MLTTSLFIKRVFATLLLRRLKVPDAPITLEHVKTQRDRVEKVPSTPSQLNKPILVQEDRFTITTKAMKSFFEN